MTSSGNGNLPLTLASPSNAVLICDDAAYNAVDRVNNYVLMDKSILKVHLPNGGFNVVKCGDATDIRVRIHILLSLVHIHVKPRLYQASLSTLRQLCDDVSDTVLIENNRVAPEWGCNPFSNDSIVFNKNIIASIIAELSQH